ncbi:MAG: TetR/AcrR family transcriptional regulator [Clostridiales bacterium]|jgi:AcrR family transcriptional regulator|nr:TetR/AcrR family transcriptional regulator [Clostridiales bacterium]
MARTVKPPEERRREILEAAKKLFVEQGYEKTQISDITNLMGVAHGLVYHYFKSKTELFDAVIGEMFEAYLLELLSIVKSEDLNPVEKLELAFAKFKQQPFDMSPLVKAVYAEENTEIRERIAKRRMEIILPLFEKLIIEGIELGCFDCPYPKEAALFCAYGEMGIKTRHNGSMEVLADSIKEMYWRVLGVKR